MPRVFGQFVRLALYVGIDLIFLPVAEPACNGDIERFNGLWAQAFFERQHFGSLAACRRASTAFLRWYQTHYTPPTLDDLTPQSAHQAAGRLHFIRRVAPEGTVALLNETWSIGKRWAHKDIWAIITTHARRRDIWHQPTSHHDWQLLKSVPYHLSEIVAHRQPAFRRYLAPLLFAMS